MTFRVPGLPARGSRVHASHFEETCGGNALNAAIGIVRLGGHAAICGPMGDARETSSRTIFEQMAREGIDTDRRSTRLNSSHGYISYAVFCLKKKRLSPILRDDTPKREL